jgi:hypothetical protein
MRATTAMGERARRRGGRGGPDDADGRGWEAAAREGLGWEAAAKEEGLGKGLGHRWEGSGGLRADWFQMRCGPNGWFQPSRTAGSSPMAGTSVFQSSRTGCPTLPLYLSPDKAAGHRPPPGTAGPLFRPHTAAPSATPPFVAAVSHLINVVDVHRRSPPDLCSSGARYWCCSCHVPLESSHFAAAGKDLHCGEFYSARTRGVVINLSWKDPSREPWFPPRR